MATYMTGVSDTMQGQGSQAIPLPQSNYQFLSGQMDKANAMYESGLQEVKSGYASIVNAPVTGIEATERKNRYIQTAQEKLKTLSSKDLSLQQNVVQAETAYAPFWEDDLLVMNTAGTKKLSKWQSQLDGWLYSKDADERAMYSDHNKAAIQEAYSTLADAPMTKEVYAKVMSDMNEARPLPYHDIDGEIETSWKNTYGAGADKGYGETHLGGGAMTTVYNGPNSYQAYKTWYLSQFGEKYAPQVRQQAWVDIHRKRREITERNPGIAPQEVDNLLAKDRITELQEVYRNQVDSYSKMADYYNDHVQDLLQQVNGPQKGNYGSGQQAQMELYRTKLQENLKMMTENKTMLETQYSPTDINGNRNEKYYQTLTDIAGNPVQYVANIKKEQMANRWAAGRASITPAPKIEVDPILEKERFWHNEEQKLKIDIQKNYLTARGQDITAQGNLWSYREKTGHDPITGKLLPGYGTGKDGKGTWIGAGGSSWNGEAQGPTGGQIEDYSTDVKQLADPVAVMEMELANRRDAAMREALNIGNDDRGMPAYGATIFGQYGMKFSDAQMENVRTAMQKMVAGETLNSDERATWAKVKEGLISSGRVTKEQAAEIKGPMLMYKYLEDYGDVVADKLKGLQSDEAKMTLANLATQKATMQGYMNSYRTGRERLDKEINSTIANNSAWQQMTVVEGNKRRLITGADIEKDVPALELEGPDGSGRKLTAKEYADAIANGKVEVKRPDPLVSLPYGPAGIVNAAIGQDWDVKIEGIPYVVKKLSHPASALVDNWTMQGRKKERPADLVYNRDAELLGLVSNRGELANALYDYSTKTRIGNPAEIAEIRKMAGQQVAGSLHIKDAIMYKSLRLSPTSDVGNESQSAIEIAKFAASPANTAMWTVTVPGEAVPRKLDPANKEDAQIIQQARVGIQSDEVITKDVASVSVIKDLGQIDVSFRDNYDKEGKKPKYAGLTVHMQVTPTAKNRVWNSIPGGVINSPLGDVREGRVYTTPPEMEKAGYKAQVTGTNKGPNGEPTKAVVRVSIKNNGLWKDYRQEYDLSTTNLGQINQLINGGWAQHSARDIQESRIKAQEIAAKPRQ
jgi:hypothetical protein